jgi:hypothetical protein
MSGRDTLLPPPPAAAPPPQSPANLRPDSDRPNHSNVSKRSDAPPLPSRPQAAISFYAFLGISLYGGELVHNNTRLNNTAYAQVG